jgi:hypothetical protein
MRIGRSKLLVFLLPLLSGCLCHTRVLQQLELNNPIANPDVLLLVETIQISSLTVTLDSVDVHPRCHKGSI